MGLEPTTFGTTIRRADQLHHIHHILFESTNFDRLTGSVNSHITNDIYSYVNEPGGIRTLDLRLRRPLLYPAELRTHAYMHLPDSFFKASRKRVMGIEPTYPAWKAGVLPLNYTRKIIGVTGFEPATSWSQTRRSSQTEPHPDMLFNYVNPLTPLLLYSIVFYLSTTFFKIL